VLDNALQPFQRSSQAFSSRHGRSGSRGSRSRKCLPLAQNGHERSGRLMSASLLTLIVAIACCAASPVWAQGSDRAWGAIALHTESGAVATGSGFGATRAAASSAAIADCQSGIAGGRTCKAVQTFNKGCAYISGGCNEETKRCGYSVAATEAESQSKCMRQGFTSCQADGGCVGQ
jgi:hypothetical protein